MQSLQVARGFSGNGSPTAIGDFVLGFVAEGDFLNDLAGVCRTGVHIQVDRLPSDGWIFVVCNPRHAVDGGRQRTGDFIVVGDQLRVARDEENACGLFKIRQHVRKLECAEDARLLGGFDCDCGFPIKHWIGRVIEAEAVYDSRQSVKALNGLEVIGFVANVKTSTWREDRDSRSGRFQLCGHVFGDR